MEGRWGVNYMSFLENVPSGNLYVIYGGGWFICQDLASLHVYANPHDPWPIDQFWGTFSRESARNRGACHVYRGKSSELGVLVLDFLSQNPHDP